MKLTDIVNASCEFVAQGHKFKQEGDFARAIIAYQRAIDLDANCDEAYHFLGEVLVRQDRLTDGINAYLQAIALNPQNHWTHHCLGQALSWLGNLSEAISSARTAIELQPAQPEFSAQLGLYFELKQDFTQAIFYYQQALKLDPNQPETVYFSLIVLMWKQEVEAVIPYCQAAVELYPQSDSLHFTQGKILASQNLFADAVMSYSQAVAIEPKYWQAYEALSHAYKNLDLVERSQVAQQDAEKAFYRHPEFNRADLPTDFDWEIYLAFNSELKVNSKLEAIAHFLLYGSKENKLYSLQHLHDPVKKPDIAPRSIFKPTGIEVGATTSKKLAVLVHIYYFDLWSELSGYIKNIAADFDLYVNIVASIWQPQMHEIIRQDFPTAKIIISANRGKDVGGHLSSMAHLDFSQYSLMCLLHTKKSPHIDSRIADLWRQDLYEALLGSPAKAEANIAMMQQNPQIGSIGSRFWRCTMMGNNWENYNRLLQEFKIKPEAQNCEYISGTMMFIRPEIMATIYDRFGSVELESGDARELNFHIDGQVAHALERAIGNLVRDRNLTMFWQE